MASKKCKTKMFSLSSFLLLLDLGSENRDVKKSIRIQDPGKTFRSATK
jgi:hypothetical protein